MPREIVQQIIKTSICKCFENSIFIIKSRQILLSTSLSRLSWVYFWSGNFLNGLGKCYRLKYHMACWLPASYGWARWHIGCMTGSNIVLKECSSMALYWTGDRLIPSQVQIGASSKTSSEDHRSTRNQTQLRETEGDEYIYPWKKLTLGLSYCSSNSSKNIT